jgi:hypothetical protein
VGVTSLRLRRRRRRLFAFAFASAKQHDRSPLDGLGAVRRL